MRRDQPAHRVPDPGGGRLDLVGGTYTIDVTVRRPDETVYDQDHRTLRLLKQRGSRLDRRLIQSGWRNGQRFDDAAALIETQVQQRKPSTT